MHTSIMKRIISVIILIVFLMSQITVANGTSSSVQYCNAAQYASSGKTNCYPDKGEWGEDSLKKFYIEYNSETGNEIKPVDKNSDFFYCWYMPLKDMDAQINDGLQYNIRLDVFGHLVDGDTANIFIDFFVPCGDGTYGFITDQSLHEDVELWNHKSFYGYVPENATHLRLRLAGVKAKDAIADKDCAIYFRNIEVYIIDDIPPQPLGIEYGAGHELGTAEERRQRDFYGAGTNVYMDVEFNEPVFVNDPGYLAYARNLNSSARNSFAQNELAKKFPNDRTVLEHVLNNNGRTAAQQFGELRLKFKYKNSDGTDKTGYAAMVDKSEYNKETHGNDYSKQIKFRYIVRQGDDFKADDIYEMELEGGIITDNSFNMIPDGCRKIRFDSNSEGGLNTVYRSYIQNFRVETTPPVLLEINGRNPDGQISENTDLELSFKFSEPVYITMSDEAFSRNNIDKYEYNYNSMHYGVVHNPVIYMNSQYVDHEGKALGTYGSPTALYSGGNGTTMLKFNYRVHENKFDPLEAAGTELIKSDGSCGEVYVMDAAGNTAPLLQNRNIKLSDNKWYLADREPPEIYVQSMKGTDKKGGFYVKIDVADKGAGVDYDNLRFGFGYADSPASSIKSNMKSLVPGRKYHSEELKEMFGVDVSKSDSFRVVVLAKDKKGNYHFSPVFGEGWDAVINIDTAAPTLNSCYVNKDKYSSELGHFSAQIVDGGGKSENTGLGSSPDIKYKWVSAGFNPDMEEWIPVSRAYHGGLGYYHGEGPGPSTYIYKDADLYIKAVDLAGNESVFHIPKALTYNEMANTADKLAISLNGVGFGRYYNYEVKRLNRNGIEVPYKGLWYCMTREAGMPEFAEDTGVWKYKDGNNVNTSDDFGGNPRDRKGYYYLHVRTVDSSNNPIGTATIPDALLFDFEPPRVSIDEERQADGSFFIRADVTDEYTKRGDIKAEYYINDSGKKRSLPANGEIIISKDMQNPEARLHIDVTDAYGNYNYYNLGPYKNDAGKLTAPYVSLYSAPKYNGKAYTNEDFVQLSMYTEADEFSYSQDGKNWSNWIPLKKENGVKGYGLSLPYVPLPQREGELTFYTRYRTDTGKQSDPVAGTVIRDVSPPTGKVRYGSYPGDIAGVYIATLAELSDNLCSEEAIKILGWDSMTITANEPPEYFTIQDVAGNIAEVKAQIKMEIPPVAVEKDKDEGPSAPADRTPPVISVDPNGSAYESIIISPKITVTDGSVITKIEYAFSISEDPNDVVNWIATGNGSRVSLSGVEGTYYLHVRATDAVGNTAVKTSNPYNMILGDNEPYVVFSGELEGVMKAYIVSPESITVSKAVYGELTRENPDYKFYYKYEDGTEDSIEDEFTEWGDCPDDFKGTVSMDPDKKVTSGDVTVIVSAPTDLVDFGSSDVYLNYDRELEFRIIGKYQGEYEASGILNERLVSTESEPGEIEPGESGSIKIIDGYIGEWDGEVLDGELLKGKYITEELLDTGNVHIFKAEITVKENGIIAYHVDDGDYQIKIGHIVDPSIEDNVTTAYMDNRIWTYGPQNLLASSSSYVAYAALSKAGGSLSGTDLTPPKGQITYTADDPKNGPVTANIKLSDNSGREVTITNNGGSSKHVFNANGQFVFEFVDEGGNSGRALAEVSTIERTVPKAAVLYSTKLPTKDAVKVTLLPDPGLTLKKGDMATVFENGSYSFNAVNNGRWNFTFINEAGDETEVTAAVENIDKIPPVLRVDYISDFYNNSVTAIVRSEELIFPAEGGTLRHVFKENGKHILKAQDACGNEASITASVDYIDMLGLNQSDIDIKADYSTTVMTGKPVKISLTSDKAFTVLNNNGKAEKEAAKNGIYQFIVRDDAGLIKLVEAEVKNIDTEAPVITLGYPEEITLLTGEPIDLMKFTAVDNFDGDITDKVKVEGNVNAQQPGKYQAIYSATDSCGNSAVKVLEVVVLGRDDRIVLINGIKHESEPITLSAKELRVSTKGFAGQIRVKWAKGFETEAFFKDGGTEAAANTVPIAATGWLTLYVYDNERNSRLVHVLINSLGGEQQ